MWPYIGHYELKMQEDNELCLYSGNGQYIWTTLVKGVGIGKASAKMQDGGTFLVADGKLLNNALWCTMPDGGNIYQEESQSIGQVSYSK